MRTNTQKKLTWQLKCDGNVSLLIQFLPLAFLFQKNSLKRKHLKSPAACTCRYTVQTNRLRDSKTNRQRDWYADMDIHIVVFAILYAYGIWNLQYVSLRMFIGNNVIMSSMHESNCWCHACSRFSLCVTQPSESNLLTSSGANTEWVTDK